MTRVLLIICLLPLLISADVKDSESAEHYSVYIFMAESCRICEYYSIQLRELHEEYADEGLDFYGVFPNRKSSLETVTAYKEKYDLPFEMIVDRSQEITERYDARVTPEVVVVEDESQAVIYKGRIDDAYYRVGRRRQVSQTSELRDVLEALRSEQSSSIEWQEAIGCVITRSKS